MPSPICLVNGTAAPGNVAAGSTVTISLATPAGCAYWSLAAVSTDETGSTAAVNASISINMGTLTATLTAPAILGSAVRMQSTVGVAGYGVDANGVYQPSFTTTFKINVLTSGGLAVGALNEVSEQNAAFGWIVLLNSAIRTIGGAAIATPVQYLTSSSSSKQIVVAGPIQRVDINTTGGAFNGIMPTASSCNDGQEIQGKDNNDSWGTHQPGVTVESGTKIEDPQNPGTYVTGGTLLLPKVNGANAGWTLYKGGTTPTWGLS